MNRLRSFRSSGSASTKAAIRSTASLTEVAPTRLTAEADSPCWRTCAWASVLRKEWVFQFFLEHMDGTQLGSTYKPGRRV